MPEIGYQAGWRRRVVTMMQRVYVFLLVFIIYPKDQNVCCIVNSEMIRKHIAEHDHSYVNTSSPSRVNGYLHA
jgi:hypothetical protein